MVVRLLFFSLSLYSLFIVAYLYETHLHTAGVSKCAKSKGSEYIKRYIDKGYSGIIVTDHFFNGNTLIKRNLPWPEWVKRFYGGYEEAKEAGERFGLDVFFGWEETFDVCDDYLVYGLDREWLLRHPEARNWSRGEQYRAVKEAGGCVVQAHPFRQRYYIDKIVLSSGCVGGVEAANGGHEDASWDALAYKYAKKLGKTITAGSDIHDVLDAKIFGVRLRKKLANINDYVKIILNNEIAGLEVDESRFELHGAAAVTVPIEVRDKDDAVINSMRAGVTISARMLEEEILPRTTRTTD
jgi:hypothetical protein